MSLFRRSGPRTPEVRGPSRLQGNQAGRYAHETASVLAARGYWSASWRDAAEGCDLVRRVHVAAGVTVSAPRLGGVITDPAGHEALLVEMLPGQLPEQYRTAAQRLALALGCGHVRIVERGGRWLALHLLPIDPLAAPFDLATDEPPGFLGVDEDGRDVVLSWSERLHTVVQGGTGSGKSTAVYGWLSALAGRPDVQVAGLDPSGLLWRPWAGLPGASWRVSGLIDGLTEHRTALRELCAEMDRRLAQLPAHADVLTTDAATPLLVVVLEELTGLYRAADLIDRKVGAEVRGLVARLYSEGRKVGLRVIMLVQRADAAVVDGAVRAQAGTRVSFACDGDALPMLHPRGCVDPDAHAVTPPGIAVVTLPGGRGTFRLRAGALSYAEYVDRVTAAAASPALAAS